MKYDLIIPTRDSAKYIGTLLRFYRERGVEPLYVVDARSSDDTLDVLRSLGARVTCFEPWADFAEAGMIEHGARAASADWVVRMDDDEFPSQALLEWLETGDTDASLVGACRREVHWVGGRAMYSRWPTRLRVDPSVVNYQYRIFRRDAVKYVERVHTPGYDVPRSAMELPGHIFFVHLNCIVHDVTHRLSKVRTYAALDFREAWTVVDECLPEYLDAKTQNYSADGLDEFARLIATLPPAGAPGALPGLTEPERLALDEVSQRAADVMRDLHKRKVVQSIEGRLGWAPKFALREASKLLCSVTSPASQSTLRTWGEALWNFAEAVPDPEAGAAERQAEPPGPPQFLYFSINKRCNLRCQHCSFWAENDDDRDAYMTQQARRRVMEELRDLNPRASIAICGGESMLDADDYFDISREARRLGLTCTSGSNGTRIRTAEMAERLVREGPHEISISLNSHRADLHDRTRGVAGSFEKATNALRLLLDARERIGARDTKIFAATIIFADNYRDLPEFHDFVLNEIGVDRLDLNVIQPSFGVDEEDRFFAEQSAVDPDELADILTRCDQRFGIDLNPEWVGQVKTYFASLRGAANLQKGWGCGVELPESICDTYKRNVMVDHYGVARLCFASDYRGEQLMAQGDLRRFWEGAEDIRSKMRDCKRLCGIATVSRNSSSVLDGDSVVHRHASQSLVSTTN